MSNISVVMDPPFRPGPATPEPRSGVPACIHIGAADVAFKGFGRTIS
jgi:hypothetical protein